MKKKSVIVLTPPFGPKKEPIIADFGLSLD